MKRKHVVVLAVILLVAAAGYLGVRGMLASIETKLASLGDMEMAQVDLTSIEDGVYTGSYSVFPVSAEVQVTVKDHRIAAIDLLKHNNGQGAPAEVVPGRVVEFQSLQVDVVSGATYSSRVILKAIENALLNDRELHDWGNVCENFEI